MQNGNNGGGASRATVRRIIRGNNLPAAVLPIPAIAPAAGDSDVQIVFPGLNFAPDTKVVVVPDAAAADETATVVSTATASSNDGLGSISADFDFVNLPAATANLFQVFLTGANGGRTWIGTISSV